MDENKPGIKHFFFFNFIENNLFPVGNVLNKLNCIDDVYHTE